jgi:hypothetical protein
MDAVTKSRLRELHWPNWSNAWRSPAQSGAVFWLAGFFFS